MFCTSSIALYLLMIGPAAVESGKQPGIKLSGGFPSWDRRCSRVLAHRSVVLFSMLLKEKGNYQPNQT